MRISSNRLAPNGWALPVLLSPVLLLLVAVSWCPFGVAPVLAQERVLLDQVRIVVDDLVLTQREVSSLLRLRSRELRQQYEGTELQEQLQQLERNLIDRFVEDMLLEGRARRLGIEIDEDQIESRLDSIVAREPAVLETYGEAEIKAFILKDLLKQQVLQREVNAFVHVRDEEVLQQCRDAQRDSRQVRVAHILVRGDGEAEMERVMQIRLQLTEGADFLETAEALSEDPSARQNRGDLGFISRGQFVKPFEDAAFALEPGTISRPVKTQFGLHLITVLEEQSDAGADCDNLDSTAWDRFSDQIYGKRREERLTEYLGRLRENAQIRILDPSS